jgi:hypothetical protein
VNVRQFIAHKVRSATDGLAGRFRRWMHGDAHEDYVRRHLEADRFDRDCAREARDQ